MYVQQKLLISLYLKDNHKKNANLTIMNRKFLKASFGVSGIKKGMQNIFKYEDHKQDKVVFFILFAVSFYMIILSMILLEVNYWGATHWLLSIQEGFYSRAVVGTIIQAMFPDQYGSISFISTAAWFIIAVLTAFFVIMGYQYWKIHRNLNGFFVVFVLLVSPGTIQYFTRTAGFFDQIGYVIIIITVYYLPRVENRWQWLVVGVVAFVLTLLHEVFLFLIAPVLIAVVMAYRINKVNSLDDVSRLVLLSMLSFLPAAMLALVLLTIGRLDYNPEIFNQALQQMQATADFPVSERALMIQFRTISDNLQYTTKRLFDLERIISVILAIVVLLPSVVVAFTVMVRSLHTVNQRNKEVFSNMVQWMAVIFCLIPLLLVFIGHDYPRWLAAAMTNLFIAGMIIEVQNNRQGFRNGAFIGSFPLPNYFLVLTIIFSLVVGPVTNMHAPIFLRRYVPAIAETLSSLFF